MIRDREILMAEIFVISQVNVVFRGVTNITNFFQILLCSVWEDEVRAGWASPLWAAVGGLKRILMDGGGAGWFASGNQSPIVHIKLWLPNYRRQVAADEKLGKWMGSPGLPLPGEQRCAEGLGPALCRAVWREVGNNLMQLLPPHPHTPFLNLLCKQT